TPGSAGAPGEAGGAGQSGSPEPYSDPAPSGAPAPPAVLDVPAATTAARPAAVAERETPDTIDLLGTAGVPVLQRAAPILPALLAVLVLLAVRRRHRD